MAVFIWPVTAIYLHPIARGDMLDMAFRYMPMPMSPPSMESKESPWLGATDEWLFQIDTCRRAMGDIGCLTTIAAVNVRIPPGRRCRCESTRSSAARRRTLPVFHGSLGPRSWQRQNTVSQGSHRYRRK